MSCVSRGALRTICCAVRCAIRNSLLFIAVVGLSIFPSLFPSLALAVDSCQTIDFQSLPPGTIVTNQFSASGVQISANNNRHHGPDAAILFNSASPTGGDADLGTPNNAFGGPGIGFGTGAGLGNNLALGHLLIIAEDVVDSNQNNLVDDPDDEADGGKLVFEFSQPRTIPQITLVDMEGQTGSIKGFQGNSEIFNYPIPSLGDNSAQTIDLNGLAHNLSKLEVHFSSSGAIAQFQHCPPPPMNQLCYAVADQHQKQSGGTSSEDTLAFLNRVTAVTGSVDGQIPNIEGIYNIEAIAFKPGESILYAANANQLGTLNLTNGNFIPLPNSFGSGQGYLGSSTSKSTISINDVDGLSFEVSTGKLWGSHRRGSSNPDLLVQIDIGSGKIVKNAFPDPVVSGQFVDFVEIAPVAGLKDIDDIAIDPLNSTIYGVANSGGSGGMLVIIDKQTGATSSVGNFSKAGTGATVNDIEGLSFFNDGSLYASTGGSFSDKNSLFQINKQTAEATFIGKFTAGLFDIEAIACLTDQSGAVKIEVSANGVDADTPAGPSVLVGSQVEFNYLVSNTGQRKLVNIVVTDATQGAVCTIPELQPGQTNVGAGVVCKVTISSALGQYASTGSAVAQDTSANNYSATDPVHYLGFQVYTISGKAFLNGSNTPLEGVSISSTAGLPGQTTAADGSYSFTSLVNGNYTLTASKPGLIVVSQSFSNPVTVAGSNQVEKNFFLACAQGLILSNDQCINVSNESITVMASDGTFKDYVLVSWTSAPSCSSYQIYRSDIAGVLGSTLGVALKETTYEDRSAAPDQRYQYTIICDTGVTSNQDEGWRPGDDDQCAAGQDCIFEELEPSACANANGFLGQINIASVINRFATPFSMLIEYRDRFGDTRGSAQATIAPMQKMDFIVNELGLEADTYGTVCVSVDTNQRGAWSGGVTLYKSDELAGNGSFGSAFDFVLYYPFNNPRTGSYTLPLNTYHLGVRSDGTIANWIRITDAVDGDGLGLLGTLNYFDGEGNTIETVVVNLPDGGRFDYSGHEGIAGAENINAIGMARFVPDSHPNGSAAKYYISLGRYFYNCFGATCNNFYTAFVLPRRPATTVDTAGGVSTVDGELSILEFNNVNDEDAQAALNVFGASGSFAGADNVYLPARGTRHEIINRSGDQGFFAGNTVGSANVSRDSGSFGTVSIFYKLDLKGVLEYAYAAPLVGSPGIVQHSEFNSFIDNTSNAEFHNTTNQAMSVQLSAQDADNKVVLVLDLTLDPKATTRVKLDLPANTYGTLTIQSSADGLVFRNYVSRKGEYVLAFPGS